MGFTSENKPEKQITMGILAHLDAGNTTLSEGILYTCKAIRKLGRVDHQDAFLDTNTLERNRGITIFSKQAGLFYWIFFFICAILFPVHLCNRIFPSFCGCPDWFVNFPV